MAVADNGIPNAEAQPLSFHPEGEVVTWINQNLQHVLGYCANIYVTLSGISDS